MDWRGFKRTRASWDTDWAGAEWKKERKEGRREKEGGEGGKKKEKGRSGRETESERKETSGPAQWGCCTRYYHTWRDGTVWYGCQLQPDQGVIRAGGIVIYIRNTKKKIIIARKWSRRSALVSHSQPLTFVFCLRWRLSLFAVFILRSIESSTPQQHGIDIIIRSTEYSAV